MIHPCDCKSEDQDKMYGKGQRVHNQTKHTGDKPGRRCTVCGKTKEAMPTKK